MTYREEMQTTFERLLDKKRMLDKSRSLPAIALQKIKESLNIEWAYNSNGIEGNSLTLRETQLILQEGITIKGKSLREHFEAKNHEIALNKLYHFAKEDYLLSVQDILTIHSLVMRSIEDEYAGRLRDAGVRITGANFVPPNALKVPAFLDDLIAFVLNNPLGLNPIELTTVFHHKFVWIHPFFDGNGRTVRLIMNLLLIKEGFPPAIILRNDRKKYFAALNSANSGDYRKLMLLMCQSLERSLNIYWQAIPDNNDEYTEISDLVQEPGIEYGQEYISLLARQGKIDAYKEGRNWLTSRKALENYMAGRKRKR